MQTYLGDVELAQDEIMWDSEFCVDTRQHEIVGVQFVGAITAITQGTSALASSCYETL